MALWQRRRRRRRARNTAYRRLFPSTIFQNQRLFRARYRLNNAAVDVLLQLLDPYLVDDSLQGNWVISKRNQVNYQI